MHLRDLHVECRQYGWFDISPQPAAVTRQGPQLAGKSGPSSRCSVRGVLESTFFVSSMPTVEIRMMTLPSVHKWLVDTCTWHIEAGTEELIPSYLGRSTRLGARKIVLSFKTFFNLVVVLLQCCLILFGHFFCNSSKTRNLRKLSNRIS